MILVTRFTAACLLCWGPFQASPVYATLTASPGGQTVVDSQGVTLLANADLAATMSFGMPTCSAANGYTQCVNANGSMDYSSAQLWVSKMNNYQGTGYLGHDNWQLPATQTTTAGCSGTGTNDASFAYGCAGSALGSIYYSGLGLAAPASVAAPTLDAVPTKGGTASFVNLQPNEYWTSSPAGSNGFHTFSFASGWSGSNQGANPADPSKGPVANFFYVLPMLPGRVDIAGTIYDASSVVTWLANGNLAAQNTFGLAPCSGMGSVSSVPCVNANGTMTETSAEAFIKAMNTMVNPDGRIGYLDQTDWQLPQSTGVNDCGYSACANDPSNEPFASLYYDLLGLSQGTSVAGPDVGSVGPFDALQPNLYWSCQALNNQGAAILSPCSAQPQCDPSSTPHACPNDMEWSFNFLDGFQGTDEEVNDLFVTAYYVNAAPEPATWTLVAMALAGLALTRRRQRCSPPLAGWLRL